MSGRALKYALVAMAALAAPLAHAQQAQPGGRPRIEISDGTLSFGSPGDKQSVTVTNKGTAPATFAARLAPGAEKMFELGGDRPPTLAPGQSAKLELTWRTPARAKGKQQAFGGLQIVTNDPRGVDDPATPEPDGVFGVELAGGASSLLIWIVFFPLLGIPLLFLIPRGKEELTRWVTVAVCAVPFVLGVYLWLNFDASVGADGGNDPLYGHQFVSHFVWIKGFNIEFFMGVDGVSILMVVLTGLVSLIAVGASWSIPLDKHIRGYFTMFLLLECGMMGVFVSLDFFLFYVFWEVMLLPMYFLIGIWGGPRKEYAAIKFFLYTLAGSVLMLLALIALYYTSNATYLVDGTPARHTFDIMKMTYLNAPTYATAAPLLGLPFAKVIWVGLFIGFAIKVPMFPFHTWLPDAHVEAPTAISVILAGVLLKMGTYGMMRINFPLLPEATEWASYAVAVFGVINILYGAFCAMAQSDLKKLVAYSSVSHMGYCLLGMAAFTQTGMNGAMMQMFNHGTITSMLFILVGVIYDRAHTRDVNAFGGLAGVMPKYAAFFGFAFMASLGLPGLSGFIGEALVFLGAFPSMQILTILAVTGVIVTAAYHLWAMQRIHLGPFNEAKWGHGDHSLRGHDLTLREALTLIPMAIIILVLGFYPMPALHAISTGMNDLVALLAKSGGAAAVAGLP